MTKFKMLALESELVKNIFTSLVQEIQSLLDLLLFSKSIEFFWLFFFKCSKQALDSCLCITLSCKAFSH